MPEPATFPLPLRGDQVIRRRRESVFDYDSMTLTSKVLEINPEFYSAWNLRRLIIEDALQKYRATEGGEVAVGGGEDVKGAEWMLRKELELLQAAIAHNAKVYCLWHHRLWVVDKLVQIGDQGLLLSLASRTYGHAELQAQVFWNRR